MQQPELDKGTLGPGQRVTGWVSFDAPAHGTLVYEDYSGGSIVAEWSY